MTCTKFKQRNGRYKKRQHCTTIYEVKNILDGIYGRRKISKLEDIAIEIILTEMQK